MLNDAKKNPPGAVGYKESLTKDDSITVAQHHDIVKEINGLSFYDVRPIFREKISDQIKADAAAYEYSLIYELLDKPSIDDFIEWHKVKYSPDAVLAEDDRIAVLRAFADAVTDDDFQAVKKALTRLRVRLEGDMLRVSQAVHSRIIDDITPDELTERQAAAKAIKARPQLAHIAQRCGMLAQWVLDGGASANYEQWRACLSLIKFCAPLAGGDAIEILCGGHAGYDRAECENKMADCSAPFRCETIEGQACLKCRFKGRITSPIALGFSNPPSLKAQEVAK